MMLLRLLPTLALLHYANAFTTAPHCGHAKHTLLRASNANELVSQTYKICLGMAKYN